MICYDEFTQALVSELVYEPHLKCGARKGLRVRVPPRAILTFVPKKVFSSGSTPNSRSPSPTFDLIFSRDFHGFGILMNSRSKPVLF